MEGGGVSRKASVFGWYTVALTLFFSLLAALSGCGGGGSSNAGSVVDNVSPTVVSVADTSDQSVEVIFSEDMLTPGATTPANYAVSGSAKGTLAEHPDSVSQVNGSRYELTWANGMMAGGELTVIVSNVTDLAGNPIASPNSGVFTIGGSITITTHHSNDGSPSIIITAIVKDWQGYAVADGTPVTFSTTAGTLNRTLFTTTAGRAVATLNYGNTTAQEAIVTVSAVGTTETVTVSFV